MTRVFTGASPMRGGEYAEGPTGWRSGLSHNQDYRDAVAALSVPPDVYIPFGSGDPVDIYGYATFAGYFGSSPVGPYSYSDSSLIENDDYGVLGNLTSGTQVARFTHPITTAHPVYAFWISVDSGFGNFFPISGENWAMGYQNSTGQTVLKYNTSSFSTLNETWTTGRHLVVFGRNFNTAFVWRDGVSILEVATGTSGTCSQLNINIHSGNPNLRIDEALMWSHYGNVDMYSGTSTFFDELLNIGRGL